MSKKIFLSVCILSIAFTFFVSERYAHASTMYLLPDARNINIGQEFNIDIKIDTNNASTSINSAQATIQFPAGIVNAVGVDKQNSTFGLWLEEPVISNSNGMVSFIGGAIKGVAGSSLQVLRIKFKAIETGLAEFKIVDAVVPAADGKATDTLSGTQGISVAVGTTTAPILALPQAINVEQPAQVNRPAIAAKALPAKPILRVPLYSDESSWYGHVGDAIVLWDVPADVTQVATRISHVKDNTIGTPEKILSNGKNFGVLSEGIWYVKVRFKNNVGWGEAAYYKISIDTTVPLPFDIKIDSAVSDNPSPIIQFETNDSLSGIAGYNVLIDGNELAEITSTTMKLPAQSIGKHLLVVRANDFAGNSVQDNIEFEVLPLLTPQIDFFTKSVFQGEFAFISGKGAPGNSVEVSIINEDGREILNNTVNIGNDGHWGITIKEPLAIGRYSFSATSHDNRGAVSIASALQAFNIRAKSVISLGFVELGWVEILIMIILLVIAGVSFWSWMYILKQQKRGRYGIIVGRDIEKLSDILSENIKELSQSLSAAGANIPQRDYLIAKMSENVAKIKKYLKQELDNLK